MTRKSVGSPIVNAISVIMSPRRLRSSMNLVAIMARLGIHDPRPSCPESTVAGPDVPTSGAVTTPSRLIAWSPFGRMAEALSPSSTCHWAPHPAFHSGAGSCRCHRANTTPSSEVKHAALLKAPPSAWTVTTPVGSTCSRPLVALHQSTGTNTTCAGRNEAGSVKGTGLVPVVAMAPSRWTIPEMVRTGPPPRCRTASWSSRSAA